MAVTAVVFDVGEALLDETRRYDFYDDALRCLRAPRALENDVAPAFAALRMRSLDELPAALS